jgi:hypothetical protein
MAENRISSNSFKLFCIISSLLILLLLSSQSSLIFPSSHSLTNSTLVIVNNSDRSTNKNESFGFDTPTIIGAATAAAGIATILLGLRTYQQSQAIKKKDLIKDIIYPLMAENDKSKEIRLVEQILDDYNIPSQDPDSDRPYGRYDEQRLRSCLVDHRTYTGSVEKGAGAIRSACDVYLDFLGKLEYLVSIGLISQKELGYFQYFIQKAANSVAVVNYVKIYNFPLHGLLDRRLSSKS